MNQDINNDDPISRVEISVKNAQNDIRKLFLHSTRQEIAIESLDARVEALDKKVEALDKKVEALDKKVEALDKKVEDRFDQQDKRFDKIEDTLAIIVNHLKK